MTYGRQPRINEEINWVTDEDGNVNGYMTNGGRTLQPIPPAVLERALSVANVGFDGVSDDASRLQEAINSLMVPGATRRLDFTTLVARGSDRVKINSGLILPLPQCSIDFGGLQFDASSMTSGTALTFTGQDVQPYNQHSNANTISNFRLLGPANAALPVDGLVIGVDSTVPGHSAFADFLVKDFRDNLIIGNNVYILQFRNAFLKEGTRYGLNYSGSSNTGESINFFGGSISDTQNASGTGTGVYVPSSAAGPDLFFWGTSFSYDDVAFDISTGQAMFKSCHFEAKKSNAPYGYASTVGGRPATTVIVDGGQVTHGTLATGTEQNNGRPHFFVVRPNTGDRLLFAVRNTAYNGFDKKNTELVHFQGVGLVQIDIEGSNCTANGLPPRLCSNINLLRNGDFADGASTGWTSADGGNTVTQDTTYNTDPAGINSWVSAISVGAGGSGYTTATVTLSGGSVIGAQATATATIAGGVITGITVTYGGSYTPNGTAPTVTITGDGTGATATATLLTSKRALKIVGAAAATTTRSQVVTVKPGKKLAVRAFNRIDAVSAGDLRVTIDWLDSTGATISTQTVGSNMTAVTAYTLRGNHYRVPKGAVQARINLIANAFTGTGYFSDVEAWLL